MEALVLVVVVVVVEKEKEVVLLLNWTRAVRKSDRAILRITRLGRGLARGTRVSANQTGMWSRLRLKVGEG